MWDQAVDLAGDDDLGLHVAEAARCIENRTPCAAPSNAAARLLSELAVLPKAG